MSKIINITLDNVYKYLTNKDKENTISDKIIKSYIFDEFKKVYKNASDSRINEAICTTVAHAI